MDQTLFPWWLVLLVGFWSAGLTCWGDERRSPSLRKYAGACCLAYTALLWFVLTASPAGLQAASAAGGTLLVFRLLAALCFVSALGLNGPRTKIPRRVHLAVFGLSLGGVCLCLDKPVIAGLFLAITVGEIMREIYTAPLSETTHHMAADPQERSGTVWMMGLAGGLLALGLLGCFRWRMHVEFAHTETSAAGPQRQAKSDPAQGTPSDSSEWLQRHAEFPWLATGLLVTTLALWDAQRATAKVASSSEMDLTPTPRDEGAA